jgi:diguanylate cyclase (GGDEF)-like protein
MGGDKSSWFAPSLTRAAIIDHAPSADAARLAEPSPELQGRRLEAVMIHVKEFVATVDAEWRFTFVNQQFLRTYGMKSVTEALGKTPFDIYPGFRSSVFFGAMDDVMTRRRSTSRVGFSDLTKKWYLCRGVPINGGAALFATDITSDQENREKLVSLSAEDPLTGMSNRIGLETAVADFAAAKTSFCIATLSLDRLKMLVNALGQSDADKVVLEVAARLTALGGAGAQSYRVDTDQFAIVAPVPITEFESLVSLVTSTVAAPILVKDMEVVLTASSGIAVAPEDGDSVDALLRRAGLAMAATRATGSGTPLRFVAAMEADVVDRLRVERELRKRVTGGLLEMRYQPQVDARTGRPVGIEAQVKWGMPEDMDVPLATLYSVAAESSLMSDIDAWALKTAVEHASVLRGTTPVLVHQSSATLCSTTSLAKIGALLKERRLQAARLEIEVDEATLVMDIESGRGVLHGLAEMGIKVVVRSLGGGLETLECLARSKVSAVKLGERLVSRIAEDEGSRVIAGALVGLAHGLKMTVLALGVDSDAQLQTLRDLKCDTVQGSHVAPATGIGEAGAFVKKSELGSPAKTNAYA